MRKLILASMDIQHKDNGEKGIFYVAVDGKTEAEMTYVWAGDQRIIIDHTGVSEALKGHSVGKQLVQAAVVFAREKQLKILPLCPFAKAIFEKTPDYQDVLF
ncbi:GNAT family N-acetyltransferase [soil metagenome]